MGTQTGFGFMLFVVFAASFSGCANSNTGPESVLSKSELVDRTDISISVSARPIYSVISLCSDRPVRFNFQNESGVVQHVTLTTTTGTHSYSDPGCTVETSTFDAPVGDSSKDVYVKVHDDDDGIAAISADMDGVGASTAIPVYPADSTVIASTPR
jgi:hypothetical protein